SDVIVSTDPDFGGGIVVATGAMCAILIVWRPGRSSACGPSEREGASERERGWGPASREKCARFSSSGDLGGAAPAARASAKARASASGGGAPRAVKNARDPHRPATWAGKRLQPERAGVGPREP